MSVIIKKAQVSIQEYLGMWEEVRDEYPELNWAVDEKRQVWVGEDNKATRILEIRPPLPYSSLLRSMDLDHYLDEFNEDEIPSYGMFLMQAGAGALGYFEDGQVVFHKAIKKYMVRAKSGKSQINYLNTRGKSKAGSRIRLANTDRFIEEINELLNQWEEYDPPHGWLYSCPVNLWGMLFAADPPPPFSKDDERLRKLPFDVNKPDFAELKRINEMACMAEVRWYE